MSPLLPGLWREETLFLRKKDPVAGWTSLSHILDILYLLPVPGLGRTDGLGDPRGTNPKLTILSRSGLGAAASVGFLL